MQGVDSPFVFGASGFETHAAVLCAARMNHRPGASVCSLPPCSDTAAVCSAFCQKKSRNQGCDSLFFIFRHERTRLHACRKNDLSLRFAESLQIIDELVQILRCFKTAGQNLRILAGHAVASDDVPASFDVRVKFVFVFWCKAQADECLDGVSQFFAIDCCMESRYVSVFLQVRDS